MLIYQKHSSEDFGWLIFFFQILKQRLYSSRFFICYSLTFFWSAHTTKFFIHILRLCFGNEHFMILSHFVYTDIYSSITPFLRYLTNNFFPFSPNFLFLSANQFDVWIWRSDISYRFSLRWCSSVFVKLNEGELEVTTEVLTYCRL